MSENAILARYGEGDAWKTITFGGDRYPVYLATEIGRVACVPIGNTAKGFIVHLISSVNIPSGWVKCYSNLYGVIDRSPDASDSALQQIMTVLRTDILPIFINPDIRYEDIRAIHQALHLLLAVQITDIKAESDQIEWQIAMLRQNQLELARQLEELNLKKEAGLREMHRIAQSGRPYRVTTDQ